MLFLYNQESKKQKDIKQQLSTEKLKLLVEKISQLIS